MEDKAIRGIPWTFLAFATNRAITLLSTLVLARLLVPDDFGIYTFASIPVAFLTYFASLGLAPALVVRQDLGREELATGLSMLLIMNALTAAVLAASSPLVASLLGESEAGGILLVLSAAVAFSGFSSFYSAVFQRELLFRRNAVCQAAQVLTMSVTSVTLAALGAGVWSLAVGFVAGAVIFTAMLLALAPYRVRPKLHRESARSLWGSGRGFMMQGGLSFTEQNADYFILGSALGARQLGLYSMAFRLSELPYSAIVDPISQAIFPGFARMRHSGEDVTSAFLTSLRLIALCAFPMGLIFSGAAEPFVHAVLGERWQGMIGLAAILGVWGSLRTLQGAIGWFVNAVGYSWNIGLSYAAMLTITLPVLTVAATLGGAETVAWVMVGNVLLTVTILAVIAQRKVGVSLTSQWLAVRPIVIAAVPGWIATKLVANATAELAPAAGFALSVVAGLAAYVTVVFILAPDLPKEALRQGRRALGRASAPPPAPAADQAAV